MREAWGRLSRGRKIVLALIAGLVVIGSVAGLLTATLAGSDEFALEDPFFTSIELAYNGLPRELQNGNKLGYDDAPVKLIQYEDFQCSHCLAYTEHVESWLVVEYVKADLLQIEFRHLPVVGQESVTAAVGATCAAEQDRMFQYANRLFKTQSLATTREGFRIDQGSFSEDGLIEIAERLELDVEAFTACLEDPATLMAVAADQRTAQAIGFRHPPGFVLNGTPVEHHPSTIQGRRWGRPPESVDGWLSLIDATIVELAAGCPLQEVDHAGGGYFFQDAIERLESYFERADRYPSLLSDDEWRSDFRHALDDIRASADALEAHYATWSPGEPARVHLAHAATLYRRSVRELKRWVSHPLVVTAQRTQGTASLAAGIEAFARADAYERKACE